MGYAKPPLPPGHQHVSEVEKVVVTAGSKAPPDRTIVETPPGKSDIQIVVMGWFRQAFIRTVRTYLQAVLGNLANVGIAGAVAVTAVASLSAEQQVALRQAYSALEFWQIMLIALSSAVAPAVIAFLHNAIELLTKLDPPERRA